MTFPENELDWSLALSATVIGRVASGKDKTKTYEVKWDPHSQDVYVNYAGGSKAGKATSAGDAMRVAEAFLYDK